MQLNQNCPQIIGVSISGGLSSSTLKTIEKLLPMKVNVSSTHVAYMYSYVSNSIKKFHLGKLQIANLKFLRKILPTYI